MANELFNGQPHPSPKDVQATLAATSSPVWVSEKPIGPATPKVKQSTFTANNLYWLNFSNSKTVHSLDFVVTFKPGSPLADQSQHFSFPNGYGGSTSTPFGIPFWGGDPILGPAVLTVLADGLPVGSYPFTVVA